MMFRCTIDSDHFSDPNVDVSTVVSGQQYVLRPVKADVKAEHDARGCPPRSEGPNAIHKSQALFHISTASGLFTKCLNNKYIVVILSQGGLGVVYFAPVGFLRSQS